MTDESDKEETTESELFEHHRITVDKGQGLLRIDKFLMYKIPNTSRTRIQAVFEAGSVQVNEKSVKASYRVKPFDIISIILPDPPRNFELIPENIPIDIVYEDADILIVNKAAGMVVHPAYANYTGTLVNALVYHFNQLPLNHGQEARPGLVHRIDKDTSGLLVIAKNEFSMAHLSKQFFIHSIDRTYIALVWGDIKNDSGTISGYIGRSGKDRKVMMVYEDETKGKHCITHYKVAERFGFATLITCKLETGRTHQIRASMQKIGHPLFSDSVYGGLTIPHRPALSKFNAFASNCLKIMPRQALHASELGFIHPKTGIHQHFKATLPSDFSEILDKFRKYSGV